VVRWPKRGRAEKNRRIKGEKERPTSSAAGNWRKNVPGTPYTDVGWGVKETAGHAEGGGCNARKSTRG